MFKRGLTLALFCLTIFILSTPWAGSLQEAREERVPAYHAGPPARDAKLPAILGRDQLWGENSQYPFQSRAYELAAKIPEVLYQQPCYCFCDRMGHRSLHSCFENVHGAECSTCLKELYFSYSEHKKGKTAKQIREAIIRGEWKQVDLQAAAYTN
jgi:hypothetical protein